MTVLRLALRSLRARLLATVLTGFGVALGVGLVVFVATARGSSQTAFTDAARGCDAVVSGKGTSSFAAVMNALFHTGKPTDTLPAARVAEVAADPRVLHAVPCAVGDVFRGFRVVGTRAAWFDAMAAADGTPLRGKLAPGGRLFPDTEAFEAVVGAIAAARTGLALGSELTVTHGLEQGGGEHEHAERWKVVGILEPTGTPSDRAVFIPLRSFFHVKGHEGPGGAPGEAHGDEDPDHDLGDEVRAVSTVVVRLKAPGARFQFAAEWNAKPDVRVSIPSAEIRDLFTIVQGVDQVVRWIAILVTVSAGLSVLAALYTSIHGRRREIALLRALGARRGHVFAVVTLEAVLVSLLGGAAGLVLGHLGVAAAGPYLLETAGVRIGAGAVDLALWGRVALGLVGLGLVAGVVPAWRAYRTPVASNLAPVD